MTVGQPDTPPRPRVLVVDDDPGQRDLLDNFLGSKGFDVSLADGPAKALELLDSHEFQLIVSDVRMPGMTGLEMLRRIRQSRKLLPVVLVTAYADIRDAVEAMRDGAVSYLEKPIDLDELLALARQASGAAAPKFAGDAMPMAALPADIVAESPAMRDVLHEIMLVAGTQSRVLITGENGAGKELAGELIHRLSSRCRNPLVRFKCSGMPPESLEAALFGVEGGATPGIGAHVGSLSQAEGGSLLIEEVGELPQQLQSHLLRFIQTGEYRVAGGAADRKADVRILATTALDLEEAVRAGRFREDLFYWLNVIEIHVPPLSERRDDILPLAGLFVERITGRRPRFSATAMACLGSYRWPGNLLELRNAMERAAMMAAGDMILPEHLPRRVRDSAGPEADAAAAAASGKAPGTSTKMEEVERSVILQTLRENRYNRSETARRLGISRRALIYKLRRFREQGFSIDPDN